MTPDNIDYLMALSCICAQYQQSKCETYEKCHKRYPVNQLVTLLAGMFPGVFLSGNELSQFNIGPFVADVYYIDDSLILVLIGFM